MNKEMSPSSNPYSAIGSLGGLARAKKLSKKRRQEIALMGGQARAKQLSVKKK